MPFKKVPSCLLTPILASVTMPSAESGGFRFAAMESLHNEEKLMKNQKDNLPLEGTKKELYDRLKMTMRKEAQEASAGSTRRGFLGTLLTGGVAVLGFGAATMVGQHAMAGCADCNTPEIGSCGNDFDCGNCENACQDSCIANMCVAGCVVPTTWLVR